MRGAKRPKHSSRALQLREATLGKTHPTVLETMSTYAKVPAKNKQKDEARIYEERVRAAMAHSGDIVAARKNTVDVRALRAAIPATLGKRPDNAVHARSA